MKIILVGAGRTGSSIVASLVEEGHDITVIDRSQQAIDEITDSYDIICLVGNGADLDTLTEAGAGNCQLFAAFTDNDDTNMLACLLAKRLGAEHTIARIRNPDYNDDGLGYLCSQLDLSEAINPESLAATDIFNILKIPSADNIETFSGRFELIELSLREDSSLNGEKLADLRKKTSANFLVCAVRQGEKTFIPTGNSVLEAGDRIALTAVPKELQKLLRRTGVHKKSARNVMILGAGRTTLYLVKKLLEAGIGVKVIDPDRGHCERLAGEIGDPAAVVICGDGTSQSVLLEEGIGYADAFAALTDSDEQNILTAIFASSLGVGKTIAKVERKELFQMAEKLGVDCLVSPNVSASGQLTRYARALKNSEGSDVEALYKVFDGRAEAIEFLVKPDFPYLGVQLKHLALEENTLIAGIVREGVALIPSGSDFILPGDRVVVFSAGQILNNLADIVVSASFDRKETGR
ncbi:MAG: Trk system potassium transporter TrkA [Clostridiales bacterium]|nr:Trk system potassium transporter TrkA [Clostridiales bacterium]